MKDRYKGRQAQEVVLCARKEAGSACERAGEAAHIVELFTIENACREQRKYLREMNSQTADGVYGVQNFPAMLPCNMPLCIVVSLNADRAPPAPRLRRQLDEPLPRDRSLSPMSGLALRQR